MPSDQLLDFLEESTMHLELKISEIEELIPWDIDRTFKKIKDEEIKALLSEGNTGLKREIKSINNRIELFSDLWNIKGDYP